MTESAAQVGRRASALLQQIHGVAEWTPGLSPSEFHDLEQRFDIEFADEHRAFLAAAVPFGSGWPDWRFRWTGLRPHPMISWLDEPVEGVLFDVLHDQFWHPDWGARPEDTDGAVEHARVQLRTVPRLIPVFGHRCLPPGAGHPARAVMSVHQTDVIYYGDDLCEWVQMEFVWPVDRRDQYYRTPGPRHTIPFWTDVINQDWTDH